MTMKIVSFIAKSRNGFIMCMGRIRRARSNIFITISTSSTSNGKEKKHQQGCSKGSRREMKAKRQRRSKKAEK